jgi:homospermidine synthase
MSEFKKTTYITETENKDFNTKEFIEKNNIENKRLMDLEYKYHLHKLIGFFYLSSESLPILLNIKTCNLNENDKNIIKLNFNNKDNINLKEKDIEFIKNTISNYLNSKDVNKVKNMKDFTKGIS